MFDVVDLVCVFVIEPKYIKISLFLKYQIY